MRILYVITGLGVGGAERVVVGLADRFAARGDEIAIAYLRGPALMQPSDRRVRLYNLEITDVWSLMRGYFRLRRIVGVLQPDVVHSHLVHANILCRLLRLTTSISRLVTTAHNTNEESSLRMSTYRWTNRFADFTTNVSDEAVAAFEQARAVKPGQMVTIHNGVDTGVYRRSPDAGEAVRRELQVPEDERLIVALGRLEPPKDYPNLLAALSILRAQGEGTRWHCVIAGDGSLKNELIDQIARLGLADRVSLLGVRRDVPALLSAADIFVLSSAWEGFPMVICEAMACGCVVVATDCGGVREAVGGAGLLVQPQDSSALAMQLRGALEMTFDERAAMGEAARRRVSNLYSLDRAITRWAQIYEGSPHEPESVEK